MSQVERISVEGKSYMVCAQCRRALLFGHSPCVQVPEAGSLTRGAWEQALCGPCYKRQYRETYPGEPVPDVVEGYATDIGMVSSNTAGLLKPPQEPLITDMDDIAKWKRAIQVSEESGGVETVLESYNRMNNPPDVEIIGPDGFNFSVDEVKNAND